MSEVMDAKITKDTSRFKFSEIKADDLNVGTALFILENIGKLQRKDKDIIVGLVVEFCRGYLMQHDIWPPDPDYSPPPEE